MARVRIYRFTINIVSIGIYMQYIVTNSKIFLCNDMFMVKFDLLLREAVKYHFNREGVKKKTYLFGTLSQTSNPTHPPRAFEK